MLVVTECYYYLATALHCQPPQLAEGVVLANEPIMCSLTPVFGADHLHSLMPLPRPERASSLEISVCFRVILLVRSPNLL